jgi:hypothetical protein
VGKPEERRPPGRPGRRKEDNIKTGVSRREMGGIKWTDLAQDRIGGGILRMR